jgi:hypothetical protein
MFRKLTNATSEPPLTFQSLASWLARNPTTIDASPSISTSFAGRLAPEFAGIRAPTPVLSQSQVNVVWTIADGGSGGAVDASCIARFSLVRMRAPEAHAFIPSICRAPYKTHYTRTGFCVQYTKDGSGTRRRDAVGPQPLIQGMSEMHYASVGSCVVSRPVPKNEPLLDYEPKSSQRKLVRSELQRLTGETVEMPLLTGGREIRIGWIEPAVMVQQ